MSDILIHPGYFSPVSQFVVLAKAENVIFENEDNFFKEYGLKHLYKKGKLLGASQFNKNRILISATVKEKEMLSVIMHELVHFFIHHKMKDSKLYGIEEGLANYIGGRRANYKMMKTKGYFSESSLKDTNAIDFDKYIISRLKDRQFKKMFNSFGKQLKSLCPSKRQ